MTSSEKSPAAPPRPALRIYSLGFCVLTLALLLSFILVPGFSLDSPAANLRWRSQMINAFNTFRYSVGDRVFPNILVGDAGWIYYMDHYSLVDYQRNNLFSEQELASFAGQLDQLSVDLESRGILLFVVVPPNKTTIYPEFMPAQVPVMGSTTRFDQLLEYMRRTDKTRILDLRPVLRDARRQQQVYFKTDSHWNQVGAYYAYTRLMQSMAVYDNRLAPHPSSDFVRSPSKPRQRDLVRLIGILSPQEWEQRVLPRYKSDLEVKLRDLPEDRQIRKITNRDASLPELLIYHDSFYYNFAKFIEPHFSRTMAVPVVDDPKIWTLDWIEKRNPDFVIIEIAERNISPHILYLLNSRVP